MTSLGEVIFFYLLFVRSFRRLHISQNELITASVIVNVTVYPLLLDYKELLLDAISWSPQHNLLLRPSFPPSYKIIYSLKT